MNPDSTILHIARVTIEAQGPLSIAGERVDPEVDVAVERDVNGLPAIPGTSIAGSLRHLRQAEFGGKATGKNARLFGWTAEDIRSIDETDRADAASTYQASRLTVTWARIHDAHDLPVDGLVTDAEKLEKDPILRPLLDPVPARRDHVALDHRGVAGKETKFDRSYVPPGHRFTFELRLLSRRNDAAEEAWDEIMQLLASPFWRLGGATRRGYGRVRVQKLATGCFKLDDPADYRRFLLHKPCLADPSDALEEETPRAESTGGIGAVIALEPLDFIRFGQGETLLGRHADRDEEHPVRALLLTMPKVLWPATGKASLETGRYLLVPASAVKGALAHRFSYHLHCRHQAFADREDGLEERKAQAAADHELIFGSANAERDGKAAGRAGRLYLDDQLLALSEHEDALALLPHNGIDRFSGGVRKGVLFSEELLFRPKLRIPMRLDPSGLAPERLATLRDCFRATLADLIEGRLAIGAGGSKGHGYCRGTIEPSGENAAGWLPERAG